MRNNITKNTEYRKQALEKQPRRPVFRCLRASDVAAIFFLVQYGNLKIKTKYHQVSDVLAAGIRNLNLLRAGRTMVSRDFDTRRKEDKKIQRIRGKGKIRTKTLVDRFDVVCRYHSGSACPQDCAHHPSFIYRFAIDDNIAIAEGNFIVIIGIIIIHSSVRSP